MRAFQDVEKRWQEQACDEEGRGVGARWVATISMWERIIKNHECLSAVKPPLPLLCWLHCQARSSLQSLPHSRLLLSLFNTLAHEPRAQTEAMKLYSTLN